MKKKWASLPTARFLFALALFVSLLFVPAALAADGDLDATFGTGGIVTTTIGSTGGSLNLPWKGYSMAIQSDGKMVVAGYSNDDIAVVRYDTDGTLDSTFDGDGQLTTDLGSYDFSEAIAIQSDDKIVVAGNSGGDFAVVRYNSDGTLDSSFSDDGKLTTNISGNDEGKAVAIQSDGKMVVAGYSQNGSNYDFAVVRYNSDGTLDTTFSGDGIVTTAIGSGDDFAEALAIQPDGKIVVVGRSDNGSNNDIAVVRYHSDGTLDTSFDSNGQLITDIDNDYGKAVAIQSDGKIVVTGGTTMKGLVVLRYNSDGTLDNSFSGNDLAPIEPSIGEAVAIQSDGKIVVASHLWTSSGTDIMVVRLYSDGTLDTSFSGDGIVSTSISSQNYGEAIAIQSDGKIVVAGSSVNGDNHDLTVVRYESGSASTADTVQSLIDAASPGDTITLDSGTTYDGGVTVNKAVTIDLNGATVGHGSSAFTISAANVTVQNGILDGGGDTSPAVLVQAGGDNFTLKKVEVTNWTDGVQVAANVTSFKLVDNFIHDNTDAGLQIDSAVTLDGVVTIKGNLFKNNGGNGIQNDGNSALSAQYNSWGHISGAAAGDGVGGSGTTDVSNPTFAELLLQVNPGTEDDSRTVLVSENFDVALKVDAAGLYGVQYRLTYDHTLLTLSGVTDGDLKGTGACSTNISTPGVVSVFCNRQHPDSDASGTVTVSTLHFTANADTGGTSIFDIDTDELASGAQGGISVYVNNGGFGAPSAAGIRTITDVDDGKIIILATGNFTGFMDLEGRSDDSGGTIGVYDQATIAGATLLESGTSATDGSYTTAGEAANRLVVGGTYYIQVDAPLYLPTTVSSATEYGDSASLDTHPTTNLSMVLLLGGDASNNNEIDLADATCIGSDFGTSTSSCSGDGASSDVNGDNQINLTDLLLMAGNFGKTSSSDWTP